MATARPLSHKFGMFSGEVVPGIFQHEKLLKDIKPHRLVWVCVLPFLKHLPRLLNFKLRCCGEADFANLLTT